MIDGNGRNISEPSKRSDFSNSRTGKSIKNSVIALAFFAVQLILNFYSRKIFIDKLGTEILGLNTTATNLLQFLNLAELGITSAVTFSLYKPLHNNDREQINEIVTLQGKFYKRVASVIIAGAIIIMMFFPLIFHKMRLPLWYAYASFGVLLYGQLLGYFINYRQIVLSASQMEYKIQTSAGAVNLIKITAQIIALSLSPYPYIWWLILEFIFSTTSCVVLNRTINRTFSYLQKSRLTYKELKSKYSVVLTKIKQLFFHNIAGFALSQSSPLIIYAYSSLTLVTLYGNYLIISYGLQRMVLALFRGVSAGVGDLIAEGDKEHIVDVFFQLFSLRFLISAWVAFSMINLSQPFIKLWIGSEYILPMSTLIIIATTLMIMLNRNTVQIFLAGYGQYQDIWSPIIEATLNIGLSILLGYYWGLNGILCGVLISLITVVEIWKPYFLFHYGIHEPARKYFLNYFKLLSIFVIAGVCLYEISDIYTDRGSQNWIHFIAFSIISCLSYLIVTTALLYFTDSGFRRLAHRLKGAKK